MSIMSRSGDCQAQAARLLGLALEARERGDVRQAEELLGLAFEYIDEAAADLAWPTPPRESGHWTGQQQQQVQPKKDDY
jgi:hypothetical protein